MSNTEYADQLVRSLGLDLPPVAIAFMEQAPAGVAESAAIVPSACAFWREAERGVFFAAAARHFNCPVGAHVLGFALPKPVSAALMGLVGTMTACGYLSVSTPS